MAVLQCRIMTNYYHPLRVVLLPEKPPAPLFLKNDGLTPGGNAASALDVGPSDAKPFDVGLDREWQGAEIFSLFPERFLQCRMMQQVRGEIVKVMLAQQKQESSSTLAPRPQWMREEDPDLFFPLTHPPASPFTSTSVREKENV